jgi:hypothetical protein
MSDLMSKHTAGPWQAAVRPDAWRPISGALADYVLINTRVETREEAKANARLIASAPDLLAALEAIVKLADGCLPHDIGIQARAAIARARGGAA